MKIKKIRAKNFREALAQVKKELGVPKEQLLRELGYEIQS